MPYRRNAAQQHRGYSRRWMGHKRSNSTSVCKLPSIPEYPGFQDMQAYRSLPGSTPSSPVVSVRPAKRNSFPFPKVETASPVENLVHRSLLFQQEFGRSQVWGGFQDKTMEDYFNERLVELKNLESRRWPSSTMGVSGPRHCSRVRRRNSCSDLRVGGAVKACKGPMKGCEGAMKSYSMLDFYKWCRSDCWNKLAQGITSWRVFKS
ncbi:uncharacterized protein LOC120517448 [Polypterus senegalus]|uniref:uncharacterized protein LOC120517448 n=1 Tax=Polypterus senegalus TaxID=55291 RepID=UPI0019662A0C|nr:uncharacterized protein LOC120517448 [Polypterus senegalus]